MTNEYYLENEVLCEVYDYTNLSEDQIANQKYKNEVIKMIKEYFKNRKLTLMIKPVLKDLHKVNDMPYEELREEFRTQCDSFIKEV